MDRRRRDRHVPRAGIDAPAMTDLEIAEELNRRHGTTRNTKKNVAATRVLAERKLLQMLLRDRSLVEAYGLLPRRASPAAGDA